LCVPPTLDVIDLPVAGGRRVRFRVKQVDASTIWLCAEVGTTELRVKLDAPGITSAGVAFEQDG
jgi:hypothetical protein